MLQGKAIFILSLMKFDGLASTNFTVAKYLAKSNDVYYIEHPFTWKDYFKLNKGSDSFRARKEGFNFFSNGLLSKKVDGVNILISYPVLPIAFLPKGRLYDVMLNINENIIASRIKKIIKEKNIKDYIFINSYDFHYPGVAKKLRPSLSLYHCVDPIVGHYDRKHGVKGETKLVRNSDVIICTSKALYKEKLVQNENTYFVPNAADLIWEESRPYRKHKSVAHIKQPITGYIGAIERRMDYDLLNKVSEHNPEMTFVFVGPVYKEHVPDWFFNRPNIRHVPPVPYSEVPEMIASFDICMIPFKKDDISNTIFPLKLFEYLGVGKPVIVTDFNEDLQDYTQNSVCFVDDVASFNNAIHQLLENNNPHLVEKRINIAKQNTWEVRTKEISGIINNHLSAKHVA